MAEKLRIIPLGGLGEIGKNMMALEYGDDIIIVDCGVQFPEEGMLGVDLIIPDVSYLVERADRVRGILITHGHEDHIGALPFVLPQLPTEVFAPRLAHGMISAKLKERRASRGFTSTPIDPGVPYQFGQHFAARWFRVCHSIPDAMGIAINTPLGMVIHTGDFKIDHTPVDGRTIDLTALARYGDDGVLLLLSDSTYAEVPGYTPSEQVVGEALDRAIGEAPGRVMVATFASLVSRVQQVVDAAERHGRKVSIVGRSMVDTVNVASDLGYLRLPPGILLPMHATRNLPPEQVVLLTTGSQGEPTSALVRIANEGHRDVKIMPGDTVVISATPIPGNELPVSRTIDNLLRQGARVLYDRIATVHVHGHASQEELKLVLSLVKPRYFVPVHGEYRHLNAHAQIAWDMGVGKDGIFVLEDGDVLELEPGGRRNRRAHQHWAHLPRWHLPPGHAKSGAVPAAQPLQRRRGRRSGDHLAGQPRAHGPAPDRSQRVHGRGGNRATLPGTGGTPGDGAFRQRRPAAQQRRAEAQSARNCPQLHS